MRKLKDKVMDKLIDDMTKDNMGKAPIIFGANGFSMELTKDNWRKIVAENKKCVEEYLKRKKAS